MEEFEPIVVAFCCHYCAFTAADLAGTMRLQYPANVRIVRIPCTEKSMCVFLLEAFEKGLTACTSPGAWRGIAISSKGTIEPRRKSLWPNACWKKRGRGDRLEMYNMSAAMGRALPKSPGDDRADP